MFNNFLRVDGFAILFLRKHSVNNNDNGVLASYSVKSDPVEDRATFESFFVNYVDI